MPTNDHETSRRSNSECTGFVPSAREAVTVLEGLE